MKDALQFMEDNGTNIFISGYDDEDEQIKKEQRFRRILFSPAANEKRLLREIAKRGFIIRRRP
jgi:hypothetical protein